MGHNAKCVSRSWRGSRQLPRSPLPRRRGEPGVARGLPGLGALLLRVRLLPDQVRLTSRASNESSRRLHNEGEGPLKALTSAGSSSPHSGVQGNLGSWDTVQGLQRGEQWTGASSQVSDALTRVGIHFKRNII